MIIFIKKKKKKKIKKIKYHELFFYTYMLTIYK